MVLHVFSMIMDTYLHYSRIVPSNTANHRRGKWCTVLLVFMLVGSRSTSSPRCFQVNDSYAWSNEKKDRTSSVRTHARLFFFLSACNDDGVRRITGQGKGTGDKLNTRPRSRGDCAPFTQRRARGRGGTGRPPQAPSAKQKPKRDIRMCVVVICPFSITSDTDVPTRYDSLDLYGSREAPTYVVCMQEKATLRTKLTTTCKGRHRK